jgi:hypothetical protein
MFNRLTLRDAEEPVLNLQKNFTLEPVSGKPALSEARVLINAPHAILVRTDIAWTLPHVAD